MERYRDMSSQDNFVKIWPRGQRRKDAAKICIIEFVKAPFDMTDFFRGLLEKRVEAEAKAKAELQELIQPIQEEMVKAKEIESSAFSVSADGKTVTMNTALPVTSSYQLMIKEQALKQSKALPNM